LHVIDAADPLREDRIAQVDAVLNDGDAGEIPQLLVFNKIDRIEGAEPRRDRPGGPLPVDAPAYADDVDGGGARDRVWLSAIDGRGLDLLQAALAERLGLKRLRGEVQLPP